MYGQDLYGTAAAVATRFFPKATDYGVATSGFFSDVLAGGVFMATGGRSGPVLLVGGVPLRQSISQYLGTLPGSASGDVFGGPLAVSGATVIAVQQAVG